MVQTVWRFVVVQKTTEISQLQFIDKVLPYVVTQRQIPMVLRQCRKQRSYRSCKSTSCSWTRFVFMPVACRQCWGSDVQKTVVYCHARCCDDRCMEVQLLSKVLTCPLLRRQVHWVPQGRPCDHTVTNWGLANSEGCLRFSSSPEFLDIPVVQQRWVRCLQHGRLWRR